MRDMGPINSSMDVMEQTNALNLCDAFEKNPIMALFTEDTIYHCIKHGFTASSFHICTINQCKVQSSPNVGFGVDDHFIRGLMRFIKMTSREFMIKDVT
jgi:hypothetical protein